MENLMKKYLKKYIICAFVMLLLVAVSPFFSSNSAYAATKVAAPKVVKTISCSKANDDLYSLAIKWKGVKGVTGYRVYRSTDGVAWEKIVTIKGYKKTTYTDADLQAGNYQYKVNAYKKSGKKTSVSKCSAVLYANTVNPTDVISLTKLNEALLDVEIAWNAVADVSGYYIGYRNGDPADTVEVDVEADTTSERLKIPYYDWEVYVCPFYKENGCVTKAIGGASMTITMYPMYSDGNVPNFGRIYNTSGYKLKTRSYCYETTSSKVNGYISILKDDGFKKTSYMYLDKSKADAWDFEGNGYEVTIYYISRDRRLYISFNEA